MRGRSSTKPLRQRAITKGVVGLDGKNPNAVALGRLGGKRGGRARAEKLSARERHTIAVKAAKARWAKTKTKAKKRSR